MKKTLLLCFVFLLWNDLFAQSPLYFQTPKTLEFGPRLGFTTSILNSDDASLGKSQVRLAFMGGIFARYQLSEKFALQVEADYAPRGGGFVNGEKMKLTFLDLPVTAVYNVHYKMFGKPATFDVFAGVQPSFILDALSGTTDIKSDLNSSGVDLVLGSGFPMWRFLFYATTKIGLSDLNKSAVNGKMKSIVTEWTVSYRIGGKNAADVPQ